MALSFTKYLSAAGVTTYAVPFPFIDKSHVVVSVDGFTVPFEFTAAKTIRLLSPLPAGSKVLIRRATPREPLVSFGGASVLTDSELNLANKQSIYLSQELEDSLTGGVTGATAELEDLRLAVFSITSLLGTLSTSVNTITNSLNTISQRVGALSAGAQSSQSGAQPGEVRTFTTVPAGWTPLISTDEPAVEGVVHKSIVRSYLRKLNAPVAANRRIRGIFTTDDGLQVYARTFGDQQDFSNGGQPDFEICRPFNYRGEQGPGNDVGPIPAFADYPIAFVQDKLFVLKPYSPFVQTAVLHSVDRFSKAATQLRALSLGDLRFPVADGNHNRRYADVVRGNGVTQLLFYTSILGPNNAGGDLGTTQVTYTIETNSFTAHVLSFESEQAKAAFFAIPAERRPVTGAEDALIYKAITGTSEFAPGSRNSGRIYDTPYVFYARDENAVKSNLSVSWTAGFAYFDKVDRTGKAIGTYALNCRLHSPGFFNDSPFLVQRISRSTFCFMREPENGESGYFLRVVTDLSPPGTLDNSKVSYFDIAIPQLTSNSQLLGEENGVVYIIQPNGRGEITAIQTGAAPGFNGILTTAVKNTVVPITTA